MQLWIIFIDFYSSPCTPPPIPHPLPPACFFTLSFLSSLVLMSNVCLRCSNCTGTSSKAGFEVFIGSLFNPPPGGPHRSVFICRVQDLRELGELSPHWDNLRKEVMTRYGGIISSYQETLAELDKITGTSSHFTHLFISFITRSLRYTHVQG